MAPWVSGVAGSLSQSSASSRRVSPVEGPGRQAASRAARLISTGYRAVGQHVADALRRIGRIERQERAASLEDAEHGGEHIDAALVENRDEVIRLDAHPAQPVRDLVGSGVQFAIADADPIVHGSDMLGCGARLRLRTARAIVRCTG